MAGHTAMTNLFDTTDPVQLGERLRLARARADLTQQEAADKLKLARTTLIALEKGQRRVRADELKSMSDVYGISINALLRPTSVLTNLVPRFRAIAPDEVEAADAALLLNDLAAAQYELESILSIPFRPNYPPERPIGFGDIRQQAEDVAMEIRQRLGIGLGAISDLVSLLELEFGVRVFIRALSSSKISGLFAFEEKIGACILLNKNHPRERRAITAAHELGHLIATRTQPDVVELHAVPQTREERFAAAFSYALLMPAALVRRRFSDLQRETGAFAPRHLILLAHQMAVSEEALCRRLEELSLLPAGTWESLRDRGFSGELVRRVLGDRAAPEASAVPPRQWFLAAEAYRRGLLSEGQIARMLRVDRVEVRGMFDALGAEEDDGVDSFQVE
jgi:Zn-dependent peptidase ImmA (M78 family)/transcriptional regulator with XRE-family HTH domain